MNNREIKFKVYTDNKLVNIIDFSDKEGFIHSGYLAEWFNNGKLKLAQYTGLKDRIGREIYEGDIVEIIPLYLPKQNSEVIMDFGAWGLRLLDRLGYSEFHNLYNNNTKIIGNIYENPELIKP